MSSDLQRQLAAVALLSAIAVGGVNKPVLAETTSTEQTISFEGCQYVIRQAEVTFGQVPITLLETHEIRTVRFLAKDGSLLITCYRPTNKMVLIKSTDGGEPSP